MNDQLENTTFVFKDTEVKLTGRRAVQRITSGTMKGQVKGVIFEITPKDIEEGSWKRWVKIEDLFEIIEKNETI